MRRDKKFYSDIKLLENAGWDTQKVNQVRFNDGSDNETIAHQVGKTLAARLGMVKGYSVMSEITHQKFGEIDILWFGNPERKTVCVELEHSPTEAIKASKLDRYVKQNPAIHDMHMINLNEMPMHMVEAYAYIETEVFG